MLQTIKRPTGVVISSLVLGLAAFVLIGLAGTTLLSAFMIGHLPPSAMASPGAPPPPPGLMSAVLGGASCFYLLLAAWAIATLVGLLRMRSWARISIMIIGGGLAFIGLISALATAAVPMLMKTMPAPPTPHPGQTEAMMHTVLFIMAACWLLVAAIGVWWIAYFAMRPAREAFTLAATHRNASPSIPPQPDSLNFSTAQPIELPTAYAPAPAILAPPSATPARPISITILAILLFCGTASFILMLALPIPLIFLGKMFANGPAHAILFLLALWTGLTAYGMLKLYKPAWFMAIAYCAFGVLNSLSMLLPSSRIQMQTYSENLTRTFTTGLPTPTPTINPFDPRFFNVIMLPSLLVGLLVTVFIVVLLWRARWAFEPKPHQVSA